MTLRNRLIALAAVCVLPAALLLAVYQVQLRREREAEVRQQIARLAQGEADYIAGTIKGAEQLLTALELSPAIRDRNASFCSALLMRLTQENPIYARISADDFDGRSYCSSEPGRAEFDGGQAYFRDARTQRQFTVGGLTVAPFAQTPVLPMARPVFDADGSVTGMLVVSLDLDRLNQALEARLPPATTLSVLDRGRAPLLQVSAGGAPVDPAAVAKLLAVDDGPDTADLVTADGHTQIIAYAPVEDERYGLIAVAARDRAVAFAPLTKATREGAAFIVAALALAVLAAAWMAWRSVHLPVRSLLATAERLRAGDFAARSEHAAGGSELSRLGQAFNALAIALQEREQARAAAQEQLRRLASSLEVRVDERTRELAGANARLAAEAAERQRTEAALAQSQKLESLGKLTGGVAHDFNNLLTAILGSLEMAMRGVIDERVRRLLTVATQAAQRGAKLTAQMLAFSRKQDLSLKSVSINDTIAGMSGILQRAINPLVRVTHDLDDDLWPAMTDQVQLEVAILNLAVNAQDAMPEGGELLIRTRNVSMLEANEAVPALPRGDYAMMTISDTGHGMPPEVKASVFEPFFTTKGPGKGTGLGLSMVYGFVRQAGGTVTIDSSVGHGTAVSIYLPRADTRPEAAQPAPASAAAAQPLGILLVDDDPHVRAAIKEMLLEAGHDVAEAASGAEAVEVLAVRRDFDVLVVDFAMPGMSGANLAEHVQVARPELPILFMTGYVDSDTLRAWAERGYRTLNKPFHAAELARALRDTVPTRFDAEA
jgi:signal transduction histidine kinase/ActR/RegA family two-component response regulator